MKYQSIEDVVRDIEENPIEKYGHIYHPIPFPEFDHLETSSRAHEVRRKYALIRDTLLEILDSKLEGANVLDVGANAGLFTFELAKLGVNVVAFEPSERYGPVGAFLAQEKGLPVEWHATRFDPATIGGRRFDAALMLSVFQWMSQGGSAMKPAVRDLRHISEISRCLFFELGYNKGNSAIKTRLRNHYGKLLRFLGRATTYRHFHLLSTVQVWEGVQRYLVLCSHEPYRTDPLLRRIIDRLPV